jgi:hypothetical protein
MTREGQHGKNRQDGEDDLDPSTRQHPSTRNRGTDGERGARPLDLPRGDDVARRADRYHGRYQSQHHADQMDGSQATPSLSATITTAAAASFLLLFMRAS